MQGSDWEEDITDASQLLRLGVLEQKVGWLSEKTEARRGTDLVGEMLSLVMG